MHFNLLICLPGVASRPCQGEEAEELVEYLLGLVLWKLSTQLFMVCTKMTHEEHVEMKAMFSDLPSNV